MNDAGKAGMLGGGLLGEVRFSPMEASAWERASQLSGTWCGRLTFPPSSGGRSLLSHLVECLPGSETETTLLRATPSLHTPRSRGDLHSAVLQAPVCSELKDVCPSVPAGQEGRGQERCSGFGVTASVPVLPLPLPDNVTSAKPLGPLKFQFLV